MKETEINDERRVNAMTEMRRGGCSDAFIQMIHSDTR